MKFAAIFIVALLLPIISYAQTTNQPSSSATETAPNISTCSQKENASSKMAPILQKLKGINLHVILRSDEYRRAIECHGKEETCGWGLPEQLRNTYNAYPKPLLPENLTKLFEEEIKADLSTLIDAKCTPFNVINNAPGDCIDYCGNVGKSLSQYVNDPNNLTFLVTIKIYNDVTNFGNSPSRHPYGGIEDGPDQRIALITWKPFRKYCVPEYLAYHSSIETVIPLNLDEKHIEERLNILIRGAGMTVRWLQTWSNIFYEFSCSDPPTTKH